jgi:hypothetical protein
VASAAPKQDHGGGRTGRGGLGDDGGIPAGTAFEDIPDTWFCPVCGARKSDFELLEG